MAGYIMSPDDVEQFRRQGARMGQLATDASPVGHWTQALARVLQGGVGSMYSSQASQGEQAGRESARNALAAAMVGNDPMKVAASGVNNPWIGQQGMQLGQMMQARQQAGAADAHRKAQLQLAQAQEARAARMADAQLSQLKMQTPEARAQMAQQYGIQPGTSEYRQFVLMGTLPNNNDVRTSLQPVYGTDKDGNPVVMQPRSDGAMVQSKMPDGVTISRQPIKVDAGTETILLDPITRQPIARLPKNVAEAASLREQGEAQGKAAADLPRVVDNASRTLQTIEQIRSHPGKPYALGAAAIVPGIPGTQQRGFINLVEQAKGQTFLEAFNSLRGGGAITEAEGAKATQALARLDRAQSPQDFEQALADLEGVVRAGLTRAQGSANRGPQLQQPGAAPNAAARQPVAPGSYVFDPASGQLVPQGQSDRTRARTTIEGIGR